MWPKREEQTQVRMPNLSSGQRGIPAGHQAGTILRKTRLRQNKRGLKHSPQPVELNHRKTTEHQGTFLPPDQRILESRPEKTAGPANLSGSLRSQNAETRGGGSGRMDTALSHTFNI